MTKAGPNNAVHFTSYDAWEEAVKARRLIVVYASSGMVAQDGPRGTCYGAWFPSLHKGWVSDPPKG